MDRERDWELKRLEVCLYQLGIKDQANTNGGLQNNMSFQETSSSANEELIGFPEKTALWDEITLFTPRNLDM